MWKFTVGTRTFSEQLHSDIQETDPRMNYFESINSYKHIDSVGFDTKYTFLPVPYIPITSHVTTFENFLFTMNIESNSFGHIGFAPFRIQEKRLYYRLTIK